MGTRGLIIVRFNRRYYVRYNHFDSYLEGLGSDIVAKILTDPEMYRAWLERTRAEYAALENDLEKEVYQLRDDMDSIPDGYHGFRDFLEYPSELPSLLPNVDAEYTYLTNLDQEILTINESAHWKLSSIPRDDDLWLRATTNSIYKSALTISLDECPEEHMASPAIPPPISENAIEYNHRVVVLGININEARKKFLTYFLAQVFTTYRSQITQFALEWTPDSFPFRELAFALISIASGKARLHPCVSQMTALDRCIDREWAQTAGEEPPIPFGTMFHRPGEPPGVSPAEATYWFDDVLVTLVRVPDGKSITRAVAYGLGQGTLREEFQGCAALVNFFEVAGNRRTAATSPGRLPPELYDQVLSLVDHQTWINCLDVSRQIRHSCLRSFRLDHQMRIVAGPSVPLRDMHQEDLISFDAENIQSSKIVPLMATPSRGPLYDRYQWVPVVGNDLEMAMKNVIIQFELKREVSVETDSSTWSSDEHE